MRTISSIHKYVNLIFDNYQKLELAQLTLIQKTRRELHRLEYNQKVEKLKKNYVEYSVKMHNMYFKIYNYMLR